MDITLCLLFLAIYIVCSRKIGSYINPLTPYFALTLSTKFLLDIAFNTIFKSQYDTYIALTIYGSYVVEIFFITVGYFYAKNKYITISIFDNSAPCCHADWLLLLASILIFSPVLIEFKEYLFEPREIYIRTRTGYGLYYFVSIALAHLSFIMFLFSEKKGRLHTSIYVALYLLSLLVHGSKGSVITSLLLYLMHSISARAIRYRLKQTLSYIVISTIIVTALFSATLPTTARDNLLIGIVQYADYNRNMAVVITEPIEHTYGRLTFENNVISLVPRAIYHDKPKNFGSYYLAEKYYPEWFESDAGSPAFGNGVQYADFGYWFFAYISITSIAIGYLLRVFYNSTRRKNRFGYFVILSTLAGVPILDVAIGYPLIPNMLLAVCAATIVLSLNKCRNGLRPN